MIDYIELENKINEHYERMCDESYFIDEFHNSHEYLWIFVKDNTLEYLLYTDIELLEKKRNNNEYAFIRLWLDDVELQDKVYFCVSSKEAFRICKKAIEKIT